jgi:hypothetical protein
MSTDFLEMSKEAYTSSTEYIDANWRKDWDYSLKAFRNEHASGSKYLSEDHKFRSNIFTPKTRSIIRKNEASAAAALFSNMDVVNLEAGNPEDPQSVDATTCLKALLEYRLTKSIPAFQIVMGGFQDAQTGGVVCSYNYWEYQKKKGKVVKDHPCIDLRPMENIRIDAGASWTDPIQTSPYLCDIIPMYVCQVKALMASEDEKTGTKFKKYEDEEIVKAKPEIVDATRLARLGKQEPPEVKDHKLKQFDIVYVCRWFMRDGMGDEYTYYTLGDSLQFLTDPKPLEEVYFHGQRPYTMGYCILETHKVQKSGIPVLIRPLQNESHDITNSRRDNVKFVLNKRYFVARGSQTDTSSLVRNVSGGVTLTNNPKEDIIESNWPDVTSSAFVEQDRVNMEMDELVGNFSATTKVANNAANDTLGGSRMANQAASVVADYGLRTFIETWYEPTLRQLVQLERYYESDETIIRLCADKAKLFPRYGPEQLSQMIETYDADVKVNVGMGASDPAQRLQKFLVAINMAMRILALPTPGLNKKEAIKEIFSMSGYRDGARFIDEQVDPQVAMLMQQLQQMKQALEGKQMELQFQGQLEQAKLQSNERLGLGKLKIDYERIQGDQRVKEAQISLDKAGQELEALKVYADITNAGKEHQLRIAEIMAQIEEADTKLEGEKQKQITQQLKNEQELQKGDIELQKGGLEIEAVRAKTDAAKATEKSEVRNTQTADNLAKSAESIGKQIADLKKEISESAKDRDVMKQGMSTIAEVVVKKLNEKERKVVGFQKVKDDAGKLRKIIKQLDDGSTEEVSVN